MTFRFSRLRWTLLAIFVTLLVLPLSASGQVRDATPVCDPAGLEMTELGPTGYDQIPSDCPSTDSDATLVCDPAGLEMAEIGPTGYNQIPSDCPSTDSDATPGHVDISTDSPAPTPHLLVTPTPEPTPTTTSTAQVPEPIPVATTTTTVGVSTIPIATTTPLPVATSVNMPPQVTVRPSVTTTQVNNTVDLAAEVADDSDSLEQLQYRWSVLPEGEGAFSNTSTRSTSWTATRQHRENQTYTFRLAAEDSDGAVGYGETTVTVAGRNEPPDVQVFSQYKVTGKSGAIGVWAKGSDLEDSEGELEYEWTAAIGRFVSEGESKNSWVAPSVTATTTSTISVTVRDTGGRTATDALDVTVLPNWVPSVNISAVPMVVQGLGTVRLAANVRDQEDLDLLTVWTAEPRLGRFERVGSEDTTWTAPAATGTDQVVRLTLTVSDTTNLHSSRSVDIMVMQSSSPEVDVTSSAKSVRSDESTRLAATASDPDGDTPLSYWWTASVGTFDSNTIPNPTWTAPKVSQQETAIIKLAVTDATGRVGTDSVEVPVRPILNMPPLVKITASEETVDGKDSIRLTTEVKDDKDSPGQLKYVWTGHGTFKERNSRNTTWTAPIASGGQQRMLLTLTATDSHGLTSYDTITITIRGSDRPVLTVSEIPETVESGARVKVRASARDREGNTPLKISWSASGGWFNDDKKLQPVWTAPGVDQRTQFTISLNVTDTTGRETNFRHPITVLPGYLLVADDFDMTDLQADMLALLSVGESPNIYDRRPNHVSRGNLLDGDLGLGPNDVQINQILVQNNGAKLVVGTLDGINLTEHFRKQSEGHAQMVYVQTDEGRASFEVRKSLGNTSANSVTFNVPDGKAREILRDVGRTEKRLILAVGKTSSNQPPYLRMQVSPHWSLPAGGKFHLTVFASDPEDSADKLTYKWVARPDVGTFGNTEDEDTTWTAPQGPEADESALLSLTVTDSKGNSTTRSVTVRYTANRPPKVVINTEPLNVVPLETITISATATDPDEQPLTYGWIAIPNVGTFVNSNVRDVTWTAPKTTGAAQTVVLLLEAWDTAGVSSTAEVEVTVSP